MEKTMNKWQLVPIEPTEEMCRSAEDCKHASSFDKWFDGEYTPENVEGLYKTMLAAAPPSNLIKAAEDLLAHLYDPPNGQPPYEYVKALIHEIEKVKS